MRGDVLEVVPQVVDLQKQFGYVPYTVFRLVDELFHLCEYRLLFFVQCSSFHLSLTSMVEVSYLSTLIF